MYLFLLFLLIPFGLRSESSSVCLNMIVKNESAVIKRCLTSVKPLITHWVIVDTGSTDGTQKIIQECMADIPGELHERPWVSFEHNRNQALELAKGKAEYVLFIDADETFSIAPSFVKPKLDKDFYFFVDQFNGMHYQRVHLIRNALNWRWSGVVHEAVDCPQATSSGLIKDVMTIINTDGARSKDPKKYVKDALLLKQALKGDPLNKRTLFYLAQSYKDANEPELALKYYKKRTALGGWNQEVFWSLMQLGVLKETLKKSPNDVLNSYRKAYLYRPSRAEPLYRMATYYRGINDYLNGYRMAALGLTIPFSEDSLFVEKWIYDYGLLLEYSISAYWIEKYQEAYDASQKLLGMQIPANVRECVEKNLVWINEKLKK